MDRLSSSTRTSPFPPDAAAWLAGQSGRTVVLVGDPRSTVALGDALAALGYDVRASEDGSMSLPDRSVDAIVALQLPPDPEVAARVLRPGGQVAVLQQEHDTRIPWVRKLGAALRLPGVTDPSAPLHDSPYFGQVTGESFRHWQVVTRDVLEAVVRGLPAIITRSATEQERAVAEAVALYDDYGRGPDGMQLPWISHCHRAPVLAEAWAMVTERARAAAAAETPTPRTTPPGAGGDPTADRAADGTEAATGIDTGAGPGSTHPPTPRRPEFDIGDTAEGVITYVVDTGEMPAIHASTPDPRAARRPAARETPGAGRTRGAAPAPPAAPEPSEPDEPDDPDLLIRFR